MDKCFQYWPEAGRTVSFGPIEVENMGEEDVTALNGLKMRKLKVNS